jgi:predicted MFS family arabinose efflux permease
MIAVNQTTGILAMFFGPLADRFGYRLMMLVGLGMLILGMFPAGMFPFYGVVLLGFFLAGMGKSVFDPAIQAYVGERVPFERRGLVVGLIEFSWAGSTLVGIPLIAVLIDRMGWRAPFFALGGFGLIGFVAVRAIISNDGGGATKPKAHKDYWKTWNRLLMEKPAIGAICFALFSSLANDNLFVVYGAWLEKSFHLSIVALGVGTSVIGAAELAGESMTAALSDRFGLKRSVIFGQIMCIIIYGSLPLIGRTLSAALTGLFVIFLIYEFTIVTSMSLCTELMPGSRATMMSGFFAAAGVGRVVGAMIGGHVWMAGGILATGLVSSMVNVLGLMMLVWGLYRWKSEDGSQRAEDRS